MIVEQIESPEAFVHDITQDLEIQLTVLERRLHQGWQMIEDRRAAGRDVGSLEDHFTSLLSQYESLYVQING